MLYGVVPKCSKIVSRQRNVHSASWEDRDMAQLFFVAVGGANVVPPGATGRNGAIGECSMACDKS